uniref:Superoxide dismutase copper/zinc binding domain-containing protein n=1 Tax=viral metagenome TaxID=1070528 RepID=A0A6C0HAS9_9ZZZZ
MTSKAIAVFDGKIKGTVKFFEFDNSSVLIEINLSGLKKNALHGFHVHECGDLSNQCESMCAHFNPYGKKHGCPGVRERHVGDLGNLVTDSKGCAKYIMMDNFIELHGSKANIIGRGLIIHADPDDCGMGGHETSLTTGNSGKRIACAVIGIASPSCIMDTSLPFMKFDFTNTNTEYRKK